MLKVHVLFEHAADLRPYGCSHIRLLRPLTHPANAQTLDVTWGTDYHSADVVIIERTWRPDTTLELAEKIVERMRRDRVRFIYTLDDNLLDLPQVSPADKTLVRFLAREADGLLVSTEALRQRFDRLNRHVVVVPNAIDERLFAAPQAEQPPPPAVQTVIGYMGTFTHDGDLMMIYQALRAVLRRHQGAVVFQLVGGVSNPAVLRAFDGLPFEVLQVPREQVEYPNFVRWMVANTRWDLALAPLEDTFFNRYKSDIKFLDYSGWGLAGIYSQVPLYAQSVRHLETGYLAENTPTAWQETLERLIADPALRARMASQARAEVLATRSLAHCAPAWREAITAICDGAAGR